MLEEVDSGNDHGHHVTTHTGQKPFEFVQTLVVSEQLVWFLDLVHDGAEYQFFHPENNDRRYVTYGIDDALRDLIFRSVQLFVLLEEYFIKAHSDPCTYEEHP